MISNVFLKAKHKAQSESVQRMQKRDKRGMFGVFGNSAEQNSVLAVFAKAQPIQVWHLLYVRTLSKQSIALSVL